MTFFSEWKPLERKIVEVIHEGKIIKVYEDDARREGLFILRKHEDKPLFQEKEKTEEKKLLFDDFRKPLHWKSNDVINELKDNFQWEIVRKRKDRGMTRKQLAEVLGVSEFDLKSIENGILPRNDFVLVNKIEQYFRINLRKNSNEFDESPRKMIEKNENDALEEIEIIDDNESHSHSKDL